MDNCPTKQPDICIFLTKHAPERWPLGGDQTPTKKKEKKKDNSEEIKQGLKFNRKDGLKYLQVK